MRQDRAVRVVVLLLSGVLVDSRIAKDDLDLCLFVVLGAWHILLILQDRSFAELPDNFLDLVLQEALERLQLLRHKPMAFEVAVNHFPAIFLINRLVHDVVFSGWLRRVVQLLRHFL